jgi:hypothetical protein
MGRQMKYKLDAKIAIGRVSLDWKKLSRRSNIRIKDEGIKN